MSVYVELAVFVSLLAVFAVIWRISEDPEKFFGHEIQLTEMWEDNIGFFDSLMVFISALMGMVFWLIAKDSWFGWVIFILITLGVLLCFKERRSVIGLLNFFEEDEEDDLEWTSNCNVVHKNFPGQLTLEFGSVLYIASLFIGIITCFAIVSFPLY
jgi:hypothetical protein